MWKAVQTIGETDDGADILSIIDGRILWFIGYVDNEDAKEAQEKFGKFYAHQLRARVWSRHEAPGAVSSAAGVSDPSDGRRGGSKHPGDTMLPADDEYMYVCTEKDGNSEAHESFATGGEHGQRSLAWLLTPANQRPCKKCCG